MAVPLIIDTDMSIDADDVGALCIAHALSSLGEVLHLPPALPSCTTGDGQTLGP